MREAYLQEQLMKDPQGSGQEYDFWRRLPHSTSKGRALALSDREDFPVGSGSSVTTMTCDRKKNTHPRCSSKPEPRPPCMEACMTS